MDWKKEALLTKKAIATAGALTGAVLGIWLGGMISPEEIRAFLLEWGSWAPLGYIACFTVLPAFFFPVAVLALAGGLLFGLWKGSLYTFLGAVLNCTLMFFLARYVGREQVEALMFEGRLIQIGSPREVYTRPACIRAADYFGNCVYISGSVSGGVFNAPGISCPAAVKDGAYKVMLRPDCLDTETAGDYQLTVEEVFYRGSDTQVSFRAEDGTLWKKSFPWGVSRCPGETVGATLRIMDPVLFETN